LVSSFIIRIAKGERVVVMRKKRANLMRIRLSSPQAVLPLQALLPFGLAPRDHSVGVT
jgi:hypothetical protein